MLTHGMGSTPPPLSQEEHLSLHELTQDSDLIMKYTVSDKSDKSDKSDN